MAAFQLQLHKLGIFLIVLASFATEAMGYLAYCYSYCDARGHWQPGKWCRNPTTPVFCCGNRSERFCCTDRNKDISHRYPPQHICSRSSWWFVHWRVVIGLLVTLITMLFCAACCYYCTNHGESRSAALRRRRRGHERAGQNSVSFQVDAGNESRDLAAVITFDPTSPHAFQPPAYESLPKDPPKYADIFGAQVNEAYVPDPVPNDSQATGVNRNLSDTPNSQPVSAPNTPNNQSVPAPNTPNNQPMPAPNTSNNQPVPAPNTSNSQSASAPNTAYNQSVSAPNTANNQSASAPNTANSQLESAPNISNSQPVFSHAENTQLDTTQNTETAVSNDINSNKTKQTGITTVPEPPVANPAGVSIDPAEGAADGDKTNTIEGASKVIPKQTTEGAVCAQMDISAESTSSQQGSTKPVPETSVNTERRLSKTKTMIEKVAEARMAALAKESAADQAAPSMVQREH